MRLMEKLAAVSAALALVSCGPAEIPPDEDKGPIEATLSADKKKLYPGMDAGGKRVIRINNGFYEDQQISYWVVGSIESFPAPKFTSAMYVFCARGDAACPLKDGKWNDARLLGNPVFETVPGDDGYSPFWEVVVVRVPESYKPDTLKSVDGIKAQRDKGTVTLENLEIDFGGSTGKAAAIFNCPAVLEGTELEKNGADLVGQPGKKSIAIPTKTAWHDGHRVKYLDFSVSEGFFPAKKNSQGRNEIPTAPIWLPHRTCGTTNNPALCAAMGKTSGMLPIFEQELSMMAGSKVDLTDDNDDLDNNNVIAAAGPTSKGLGPKSPQDAAYSPLWEIRMVAVDPAKDSVIQAIDTERREWSTANSLTSVSKMRAYIADQTLGEPSNVPEAMKLVPGGVGPVPGNEGKLFVNCPTQLPQ